MNTAKKITNSGAPNKKIGAESEKQKNSLSQSDDPVLTNLDDEDAFDLSLDDDIATFDNFDDEDDDF